MNVAAELDEIRRRLNAIRRITVITGAGVSAASGVPTFRGPGGLWRNRQATQLATPEAFLQDPALVWEWYEWRRSVIAKCEPNAAHGVIAKWSQTPGFTLVTQNVDGLHQSAGSRAVIDLHGRLDEVRCLQCERRIPREAFQRELEARNPAWRELDALAAPDGDADLDGMDFTSFDVPACTACGGMLKPDVVFFGENVPRERVEKAWAHLAASDAMLVVGSSLMVYSGFRFAREAARSGKPIAAINRGRTRADDLFALKVEGDCAEVLLFI